jgi:uncharacterized protein YbbC (DUF1343 family)
MRCTVLLLLMLCSQLTSLAQTPRIIPGAERTELYLPWIKDKQIGLVVNNTSMVGATHLADTLLSLHQCVLRIFAPEHGFRGEADAGSTVHDGVDNRTGIPIKSLYGRKKKPTAEDLAGLDVVIFDIQDVGARFFTYIYTMLYVLEACAENNIPVIILDRPNPNGHYVDGPVLDMRFESFVGAMPLPMVHGCTVGELARLFSGEGWMYHPRELQLKVAPCLNYTHQSRYTLPIRPSPNLVDMRSILLYPSICLFEGTIVSLGRGTDWPFQMYGHPDFFKDSLDFSFVPRPNPAALNPPQNGWLCRGYDLRQVPLDSIWAEKRINLAYLINYYREFPNKPIFFLENKFFNLLAGNATLRNQIEAGLSEAEIRATWQEDLRFYREIRQKYLLYPD